MSVVEINKKLVDIYYSLLKNLSRKNKKELIDRLTRSLKTDSKTKNESWKSLYGALNLDKSSDEFIDELRKDRNFTRKTIDL